MALPLREIRSLLAESIKHTNFPVPISQAIKDQWAERRSIPRGGETVLYTGALYQLMPYTKALVARLEGLEEKRGVGLLLKVASGIGKVLDLSGIASKVVRKDTESYNNILTSVATLLSKAGIDYGCLYDNDLYSGALLYDLGLLDDFAEHARKVYLLMNEAGVRRAITVDPHTHHMLSTVFPTYIDDYDLEVISFLDLLSEKLPDPERKLSGDVVLHDPCIYGRFHGITEQPRELLARTGLECQEVRWSREKTFCCGGLMESIAPKLANYIAGERMAQLTEKGRTIVTLCPVCHVNLSRVAPPDVEVRDLALFLSEAWNVEQPAGRTL